MALRLKRIWGWPLLAAPEPQQRPGAEETVGNCERAELVSVSERTSVQNVSGLCVVTNTLIKVFLRSSEEAYFEQKASFYTAIGMF